MILFIWINRPTLRHSLSWAVISFGSPLLGEDRGEVRTGQIIFPLLSPHRGPRPRVVPACNGENFLKISSIDYRLFPPLVGRNSSSSLPLWREEAVLGRLPSPPPDSGPAQKCLDWTEWVEACNILFLFISYYKDSHRRNCTYWNCNPYPPLRPGSSTEAEETRITMGH